MRARRPAARRARSGSVSSAERDREQAVGSTSLPRSVLRNDAGASVISFRRKCGKSPRSMSRVVISRGRELVVGDRQRRCRRRRAAGCRRSCRRRRGRARRPGPARSVADRRRLAVHAQVACAVSSTSAVRLAGDDERVLGQADVQRLAAAPQREQELVGLVGRRTRRWRPSPRSWATVGRNASSSVGAVGDRRGARASGSPWRRW